MTTTKESPDSGASAECPACKGDGVRVGLTHERDCYACGGTGKVRAQDSGQGEAVAPYCWAPKEGTGRTPTIDWNTVRSERTPLFCVPLYTHPPKPAQDAAGKGVEEENESTKVTKAMGGFSLKCRQTGTAECVYAKTERIMGDPRQSFGMSCTDEVGQIAAKPAQVGGKWRAVTEDDAIWLLNQFNGFRFKSVCTDRGAMLSALQSIGAVVPAREGE